MRIRLVIVAILILGLFIGSSLTSAAGGIIIVSKTGDGIWDGSTWKVELYPGETKTTTIELYNSSDSKLNIKVRIKPKSLVGRNLIFELDKKNFTMAKKSYSSVILIVETNEGTPPGTYSAELEIKVAGSLKG